MKEIDPGQAIEEKIGGQFGVPDTGEEPDDVDEDLLEEKGESKEPIPDPRVEELERKYKEAEAKTNALQQQYQQLMNTLQNPPPLPTKEEPEEPRLEIPARPEKPKKPGNFSRQEAMSDPSSESAQYLIDHQEYLESLAEWQQEIMGIAIQQSDHKLSKLATDFAGALREQEGNLKTKQVYDTAVAKLQNEYGFNYNEALEFIKVMQDPKNLSLEELVQVFKIKKGMAITDNKPSQQFQQIKNAQNSPLPMALHTAKGAKEVPDEVRLLNKIIDEDTKRSII